MTAGPNVERSAADPPDLPMEEVGGSPTPPDEPRAPDQPEDSGRSALRRFWWIPGIVIAAVVVIMLAPLASGDPDGLEWVAGEQGFISKAQDALFSVFPDYTIPGIDDPNVSTVLAGLIGVALVFLVMLVVGRLLARRRT